MCWSQGETGMVFYLTLDVVETNCSVLIKKDLTSCESRPPHDTPVRNGPSHSQIQFPTNKTHFNKALCCILPLLVIYPLQVYGQCKAVIYTNRPHRVVRLYKYDCVVRPGKTYMSVIME